MAGPGGPFRGEAISFRSGAAVFGQSIAGKIAFFEPALLFEALFIRSGLGTRVGTVLACLLEFLPGGDALLPKLLHEVPQGCPSHLMREARIPGDRNAKGEMFVETEIARQPALHERERAVDDGAGPP